MSNRKPFNDRAGYIASLRSGPVGTDGKRGYVVIYEAEAQGMDTAGGRYATVCETHSTIANSTNMPNARASMKVPSEFCECCRGNCCEAAIAPYTCPDCGREA